MWFILNEIVNLFFTARYFITCFFVNSYVLPLNLALHEFVVNFFTTIPRRNIAIISHHPHPLIPAILT